jgi:hexosaminidase
VGLRNQILTDSEGATISLSIPIPGSKLFYTLDGSEPGENSKLYAAPFDIKLKPGERIDLKVAVVTPDKRKSITHSGVIWRRSVLAGADLGTKRPGVRAKFLFGATSLPDLLERAPNEGAESRSIQLPQFQARTKNYSDPFGVIFEGLIFVPAEEIYAFEVESDGQTFLEIGGENIVGGKAENIASRTGIVPLGKGYHLVRFGSVHRGPQPILNLRWGVNGTGLRRIYGSELFVKQ